MLNYDENCLIDIIAQGQTKVILVPNALIQKQISKKIAKLTLTSQPQFIIYGHLAAQMPILRKWLGETNPISAVLLDPLQQKLEALKIVILNDLPLKVLPVVFGGQSQALISEKSESIKTQLFDMDPNVIALRDLKASWKGCKKNEVIALLPYGHGEYSKLCRSIILSMPDITCISIEEFDVPCPNFTSKSNTLTETLDVELEAITITNLVRELKQKNEDFAVITNSSKLRSNLKCILSNIDIATNENAKFADLREYSQFITIAQLLIACEDKNSWLELLFDSQCSFSLKKLQFDIFSKSLNQNSMLQFAKELAEQSKPLSDFIETIEKNANVKDFSQLIKAHIKLFDLAFREKDLSSNISSKLLSFLSQCELHAKNLNLKLKAHDQYIDALSFLLSSIDLRFERQETQISILTLEQLDYLEFDNLIISDDDLFRYEEEDEIEASHLTQARLERAISKSKCFVFRAAQDREGKALKASKYVNINFMLKGLVTKINYTNYTRFDQPIITKQLPKFEFNTPTFLPKYSVSALEKLIRCPYVFALEYILGIHKKDMFFEYNYNKEHGQNLHELLSKVNFTKNIEDIMDDITSQCQNLTDQFNGIYKDYITQTLRQTTSYLITELNWNNVISDICEQKIEKDILNGQAKLLAIIDRILKTQDETLLIDFKTGSIPHKSEVTQGLFPQLAIGKYLLGDSANRLKSVYIKAVGTNSEFITYEIDEQEYMHNLENLIAYFAESGCYFVDSSKLDDQRLRDFYHVLRFSEN